MPCQVDSTKRHDLVAAVSGILPENGRLIFLESVLVIEQNVFAHLLFNLRLVRPSFKYIFSVFK